MSKIKKIAVEQTQHLFAKAEQNWNLQKLYQHLENIKLREQQQPLTHLEQFCLRGMLSGYKQQEIAQELIEQFDPFLIQVTFWNLFRYIQTMAGKEVANINDFQDVISSLEMSGYKTERADTILVPKLIGVNEAATLDLESTQKNQAEIVNSPAKQEIITQSQNNQPQETQLQEAQSQNGQLARQTSHHSLSQVDENDFMPPISLWTKLGGMFLVGSMGIAIALAAFTPYKVTVKANGTVRPDGKIKLVQAETAGTIVSVQVQENQTITKGDVIATIDNSNLETEANLLQNQVQQGKLQIRQLSAQTAAINRQLVAERERIDNAIAEAKVELNRTRRTHRDLVITSSAQVEEAQANFGLAQAELAQAQAELLSAQATLESQKTALRSAKSKRDRYQAIADSGALSQDFLEEAILEHQQQEQQVLAQQATVQRYRSAIARQNQAISAAQARLNNMSAALNPNDDEVAIAQKRINQAKASGNATIANFNREKEALNQQVIEITKQLERHQRQLQQAQINRDRTIIKAPISGTLFQLNLRNSGQNVQAGTEIAQIAPEQTSLLVKAYLNPQDINQVHVGRPAQMRISACPYPDYGVLKGEVTQVSPDAIQTVGGNSQETNTNAQGLYEVTIKPESSTLSQGKSTCSLQLGMEGRADIIAKEETVLRFLLRKARLIVDL